MVQPHFSGRTRILQAAGECFRQTPYSSVGVAAILDIAGVRAPSLYHHFQDKEELYVDWAESAFADVAYTFDASSAGPFARELESFTRHLLERVEFDVPQVIKDMTSLERESSQERVYGAYAQSIYEPLCGMLLHAIDKSEARLEPVGRVADSFLAGCWALRAPRGSEGEVARWWVNLYLAGLGTV
jgi:AcrR family transcriptional regulator